MQYHIIKFKDGLEQKCPVEKFTEKEIREACEKAGREIESIHQAVLEKDAKAEVVAKPLMFEVRMSYDDTKNLFVTEKELPFVYFAMENNTIIYIAGGAIRGQNIIDVTPDYNSYMGWNRDYKPTPEEYATLQPFTSLFRESMSEAKNLVRISKGDHKKLQDVIKEKLLLTN